MSGMQGQISKRKLVNIIYNIPRLKEKTIISTDIEKNM